MMWYLKGDLICIAMCVGVGWMSVAGTTIVVCCVTMICVFNVDQRSNNRNLYNSSKDPALLLLNSKRKGLSAREGIF